MAKGDGKDAAPFELLAGVQDEAETSFDGAEPRRGPDGAIRFKDAPRFRPNLSPAQVLAMGSFGGSYFRDIDSKVTGKRHKNVWKELPEDWVKDLDVKKQVASPKYQVSVNKFGVDCGAKMDKSDVFGLQFWESKDWIKEQDPFGWFQWYTRFYRGRRSPDDERQIARWDKCAGPTGRWRNNLVGKVMAKSARFDDASVSPVVRQTLQHWAYELTEADYEAGRKRREGKASPKKEEDSTADSSAAADEDASKKRKREAKAKEQETQAKERNMRARRRASS